LVVVETGMELCEESRQSVGKTFFGAQVGIRGDFGGRGAIGAGLALGPWHQSSPLVGLSEAAARTAGPASAFPELLGCRSLLL
jgi:hypothetical protein